MALSVRALHIAIFDVVAFMIKKRMQKYEME
jgi:hypothetical protein